MLKKKIQSQKYVNSNNNINSIGKKNLHFRHHHYHKLLHHTGIFCRHRIELVNHKTKEDAQQIVNQILQIEKKV